MKNQKNEISGHRPTSNICGGCRLCARCKPHLHIYSTSSIPVYNLILVAPMKECICLNCCQLYRVSFRNTNVTNHFLRSRNNIFLYLLILRIIIFFLIISTSLSLSLVFCLLYSTRIFSILNRLVNPDWITMVIHVDGECRSIYLN